MDLDKNKIEAILKDYYLGDEYKSSRDSGQLEYILSQFPSGYMIDKPVGVPDVVAFVHMRDKHMRDKDGRLEFNFFILAKRDEPLSSMGTIPEWQRSLSLWKYVPLFSEIPIKEDTDIVKRFNLDLSSFPPEDYIPRMEIIMPAKGGWMVRGVRDGFPGDDVTLLTEPPEFNPVELFDAGKNFGIRDGVEKLGQPFALFAFDKGGDITMSELNAYKSTNMFPKLRNRSNSDKWIVPAMLSNPRCIHLDKTTLKEILVKVDPTSKNDICSGLVLQSEKVHPIIVTSLNELSFPDNPATFFIDSENMIKTLVNSLNIACENPKGGRKRKSKKSMKNKRRTNRARKYTKKYSRRSLRR